MGIWMVLCCLAPILLIAILAATGYSAGSILYTVALLICPIGMIAMMFMGSGCHSSGCEKDDTDVSTGKTQMPSRDELSRH